jgi:hypothetical protein
LDTPVYFQDHRSALLYAIDLAVACRSPRDARMTILISGPNGRTLPPGSIGGLLFLRGGLNRRSTERLTPRLAAIEPVRAACDRFTIADITALVGIDIGGRLADIKIAPKLAHLSRWHETVSKRASARA